MTRYCIRLLMIGIIIKNELEGSRNMSEENDKKYEQLRRVHEQFEKGSVRFEKPSQDDMNKLDQILNLDKDQSEGDQNKS